HAGAGVGVNLEEEFPKPVHDLVVAADQAQIPSELGRPLGQVLDVRKVREHFVVRRVEGGCDRVMVHVSIHSFRSRFSVASRYSPNRWRARSPSSANAASATGSNLPAFAVSTTRDARPSAGSPSPPPPPP